MEEQNQKGLTTSTIGLMAATALFFDMLQALLTPIFLGWMVTPIAYGTFGLWFRMRGLNFFTLKRARTLGIGFVIEMIPGLDVLPTITYTVVRVALDTKFKESVSDSIVTRTFEKHSKSKPRI